MEEKIITFTANEQGLVKTGGISHYASDTISYIKAVFTLGENWNGFDEVRAVFKSPYECRPAVLDSNGECYVPVEVLFYKGKVRVNLVGSIVTETEVTDRLTTYSVEALDVDEDVPICGEESQPISPSEYEQFVAKVANDANRASQSATASANSADEAEASAQNASESASASAVSASDSARSATASAESAQNASEIAVEVEVMKNEVELAKDKVLGMRATAETLEAGSDATASYSDGLLTLGIPRGDRGEQGIQGETGATPNLTIGTVETLEPTEDATATITGTAEEPVLNLGIPKGDTGEVSLEDLEALLPTDTASGDIVTIPDGQSVIPAESLKVALNPIQSGSGTPSPDNVRPISGRTEVVTHRTGINVWDEEWEVGTINNTTGLPSSDANNIRAKNYRPCKPNTSYFFYSESGKILRFYWYDAEQNYISTDTANNTIKASPDNAYYFKVRTTGNYGNTYNHDISINYPSTDTDYHAYNGQTYTTDLGRTVYGGTLDVVSGELVITHGMYVVNGSESYTLTSTGLFRFAPTPTMASGRWYTDEGAISDTYHKAELTSDVADGEIVFGSGNNFIYVRDSRATTIAEFKELLADNNVTITYPLATPQTIQLTPQEVKLLLGTNNIWSDGEVTLTYNADIQKWVEKKLNGNSTTLTMSRPMTAELNETETETTETEETE